MGKLTTGKKIVFLILGLFLLAFVVLYIQHVFNNEFEDPIEIGKYFSYALMVRDTQTSKETMKNMSDKSLHPKIETLSYQENPMASGDFILSNYKRIGRKIVATYTLLDFKRAWHYTVVLSPIKEQTWWESIKEWIFFSLPFGNKFISLSISKDRWLVTDFYTESDFNTDEYQKLIKENLASLKENINEWINEWKDKVFAEIQKENQFLESFETSELIKQHNETKELFDLYLNEIYRP